DGFRFVESKTIDLSDAGVGLTGLDIDWRSCRLLQERLRHRTPDDDAGCRPLLMDLTDDFEIACGMAEAVAGDVEDEDQGFVRRRHSTQSSLSSQNYQIL